MSSSPPQITLKSLVADFFRDVTQAERGLLGTAVQLTLRPGRVVDTYLYMDRSRFLKPTRYLVFCFSLAAVQAFVVQTWYGQPVQELAAEVEASNRADLIDEGLVDPVTEPEVATSIAEAKVRGRYRYYVEHFDTFFSEFRTFFAMLAIPIVGFLYYLFFGRHGFNLAEALVAATYLHAHVALLAFFLLPLQFLGSDAEDYELWSSVENNFTGLYLLFGVTQVFAKRWWDTLIAFLWFLFFITILTMSFYSFVFLSGAIPRIWLTDIGFHFSASFVGHLIMVLLLLPASLFLMIRLHPQRRRATSPERTLLEYFFIAFLLIAMIILGFSLR